MTAPENMLSTPQAYATPAQIQSLYAYAKALTKESQQPVKHWTQGVSNIVNALVGGDTRYRADQLQADALKARNAGMMPMGYPENTAMPVGTKSTVPSQQWGPYGSPNPYGYMPSGTDGSGDAPEKATRSGASNDDNTGGVYADIIGKKESSNRYDAVGPAVKRKNGATDYALGRYGVMASNVPQWTKEALGKEMTPDEFLSNKDAQDAVFKNRFVDNYVAKYGPVGASKAWFGGEKGMNNPKATDVLGTSVAAYGNDFANRLAKVNGGPQQAAPGPALAFNGENSSPEETQVIAQALQQGGGNPQQPQAGWERPIIPPNLVPKRPTYTRQQLNMLLGNPAVSEQERTAAIAGYMQQFQPIQMPVTGGVVLINPANPYQQKFVPTLEKGTVKYPGGYEAPAYHVFDPYGSKATRLPTQMPQPVPVQPQRPVGPQGALPLGPQVGQAAPAGAPTGATAFAPTAIAPGAPTAPAAPGVAPQPVPTPQAKPQQFAALTDGNIATDAAPEAPAVPQEAATAATEKNPLLTTQPPTVKGPQVANNLVRPSVVPPQDWDAINRFNEMAIDQERRKEGIKKTTDAYVKRYEDMQQAASKAMQDAPMLDMASKILEDPNFYSGAGNDAVLLWNRAKSAMGRILGNPEWEKAAAPQEVFGKIIAGSILNGMKSYLQGLGQVRVAEIQLLQQANASPMNTVAANRALIEVARRSQQKMLMVNEMAQDYLSGSEVVNPANPKEVLVPPNVDPRTGEIAPRVSLDTGWDKLMRNFYKNNPTFTKDEIEHYSKIWNDPKNQKPAEGTGKSEKGELPVIKNDDRAAYDKLAPGAEFKGEDGITYTKPNVKK